MVKNLFFYFYVCLFSWKKVFHFRESDRTQSLAQCSPVFPLSSVDFGLASWLVVTKRVRKERVAGNYYCSFSLTVTTLTFLALWELLLFLW